MHRRRVEPNEKISQYKMRTFGNRFNLKIIYVTGGWTIFGVHFLVTVRRPQHYRSSLTHHQTQTLLSRGRYDLSTTAYQNSQAK